MKGGTRPLGYTIVEVMIVLAVSGVMFVIAASFISGKESSSAFTEGSNEFASQLQTIITQVVDGQYSDVSFTCSVSAANALSFQKIAPSLNSSQGTNAACDFLGKFVHFSVSGVQSAYEVFSLAGARADDTLASATPIIQLPPGPNTLDLTDQETVPESLNVKDVVVTDASGNPHNAYGIGFVQSQGTCDVDGDCVNGSQTVNMVYAAGLGANQNETQADTAITGALSSATSATICLTDGNRYAKITLGNSSDAASPLNVNVLVISKPYAVNPPC